MKKLVGTWEATFHLGAFPGAPEVDSKGTEVNRLLEGGLWVVTDYEDPNMPGGSFIGHGITGWDPYEEKYVGVWIDNQTANL
ncbi:MAG: DUF1579 family protein, partial [Planctomycetota bacterium]|nr:DUF1579 family protein [Planctomycetota bacterium]